MGMETKTGTAIVLQADALTLPLEDNSIDLIVTSPPYFALRHYQDNESAYLGQVGTEETTAQYLRTLWNITRELHRVLKPTGSLFFNIMDKYNSAASNQNGLGVNLQGGSHEANRIGRGGTVEDVPIKSLLGLPWKYANGLLAGEGGGPWTLRADIIWNKTNGLPDPTNDRVQRKHEYLFHFTKSQKYYANPEELKGLTTVWDIPTEPSKAPEGGVKHPAPFPVALPLRIIRGWCPEEGIVLDPFGGSGTTALAAVSLGRVGISADLSADYTRSALTRCSDPNMVIKARKR
jgi:DNA modification methylase